MTTQEPTGFAADTDTELLERYQIGVASAAAVTDSEERRRRWQDLYPLRDELDRRFPPRTDPRAIS